MKKISEKISKVREFLLAVVLFAALIYLISQII